jgi:hypothetical protein
LHYKLQAQGCPGPNRAIGWYGGGTTFEDATAFAVPASDIDIHLPLTVPEDPPAEDPPAEDPPAGEQPPTGGGDVTAPPAPVGGTSVAPPAAPGAGPAPAPAVAPVATTAVPRVAFWPWRAFGLATAVRSGLRVPVRCAAACAARVVVTVSAATARRLKVGRTLTTGRATLKGGVATTLVVPLTTASRRALAHQRRVTLTVSVTAAGRQLRRTLTLTR